MSTIHTDADKQERLLVFTKGARPYAIYPISSGAPSTPTVRGHFEFGTYTQHIRAAYSASAPDESLALPYAKKLLASPFWPAVGRFFAWLLLLALIAAVAYGLWWIWPRLII